MYRTVFYHLLFWFFDIFMQGYYYLTLHFSTEESTAVQIGYFSMLTIMKANIFYLNFFLLKKVIALKKTRITFTYISTLVIVHTAIYTTTTQLYLQHVFKNGSYELSRCISDSFMTGMIMCLISSAFYFITRWNETEQQKKLLKEHSYKAQQDVLHKNFEPSFISMSLTDLLNVSRTNQNQLADTIITLSDVYRYLLGSKSETTLAEELKAIDKLISMIKITNFSCAITLPPPIYNITAIQHGSLFVPIAVLYTNCTNYTIDSITITITENEEEVTSNVSVSTQEPMGSLENIFQSSGLFNLFHDSKYFYNENKHYWSSTIQRSVI